MADNTIFDSVFKTMVHKSPRLIIPFINEVFGRSYPVDSPVVQFSNEHEGLRGTIIDDSVFQLGNKIYHIECQSTSDANMVVRMIEYDFAIALEEALNAGAPYEMEFPSSCVLFLRHNSATPDMLEMKVNLPDGNSFIYAAHVVKAQSYSSQDIFNKNLLLLLPYYLMRYEEVFDEIADDDSQVAKLVMECSELRCDLESVTYETGDTVLYEELIELIIKVSDYMLSAHEALRKRVRKAMGGEVLELMRDRAERLEREAEARGIEQGIEQGIELGVEQGVELGVDKGYLQLSDRLRELGVDPAIIDEAVNSLKSERLEEGSVTEAESSGAVS